MRRRRLDEMLMVEQGKAMKVLRLDPISVERRIFQQNGNHPCICNKNIEVILELILVTII